MQKRARLPMRACRATALLTLLFWSPWLATVSLYRPVSFGAVATADAALVFGALVRDGRISPLQRERLLAAKALLDGGKVKRIVVSNTEFAARVMAAHLRRHGVPAAQIEVDGAATFSADTCRAERARRAGTAKPQFRGARAVIFVSQAYHLPRLALLCRRHEVSGQLFAADSLPIVDRSTASVWTRVRVRAWRVTREAWLMWPALWGWGAAQ